MTLLITSTAATIATRLAADLAAHGVPLSLPSKAAWLTVSMTRSPAG